MVSSLLSIMTQELQDGNTVAIQGFGTFEVKKKMERVSVNPVTQQRLLIPPKLVLTYKPSIALKEKFK
jgi:DNA-binding protein HU-beta